MGTEQLKRVKELEKENARLRRAVANLSLHIDRLMRDCGLRMKPAVQVTGSIALDYNGTSIHPEGNFARALTRIVKERLPSFIIETGTFHGTGTTAAVIRGIRESGHACRFFSLEVNPQHYATALSNLERNGDLPFVTVLNGLSVPRNLLPDLENLHRELADAALEPGLYVDFPENIRADAYHAETNFPDLPDDLLGLCLAECNGKPDLLVLDSGGHLGIAEFSHAFEKLSGPCVFALDDTLHVKHHESLRRIKADSRFRILENSDEKFGYCIAEFMPRS
jgi:hypothetical protein